MVWYCGRYKNDAGGHGASGHLMALAFVAHAGQRVSNYFGRSIEELEVHIRYVRIKGVPYQGNVCRVLLLAAVGLYAVTCCCRKSSNSGGAVNVCFSGIALSAPLDYCKQGIEGSHSLAIMSTGFQSQKAYIPSLT